MQKLAHPRSPSLRSKVESESVDAECDGSCDLDERGRIFGERVEDTAQLDFTRICVQDVFRVLAFGFNGVETT